MGSLSRVRALIASAGDEHKGAFLRRVDRLFPTTDHRHLNIMKAYEIAKAAFRSKFRDDGVERYFEHLRFVALIVIDILRVRDPDVIVAALLHDIVEDIPEWTFERVRLEFGVRVAGLVWWVTKPPAEEYASKAERDRSYHRRFDRAPREAVLIKLADRLHNLCTLWSVEEKKRSRKISETEDFYLSLAEREICLIHEIEEALAELRQAPC